MRVLNLYAGLGGNRKLWQDCHVTAVECDPKIASAYARLYPSDTVIVGDAHDYLLAHYREFDFVWSSPPCQTHSRMNKATRHDSVRYVDMTLYQEIVFLRSYFGGIWVVENVVPYYTPVIRPNAKVGRHLFWSNSLISLPSDYAAAPADFARLCGNSGKLKLMEWLGIYI